MTGGARTLASLRRVSGFPLSTARYFGDYRIREFAAGAVRSPADIVPFFEGLFAGQGYPVRIPGPPGFPAGGPACSAFWAPGPGGPVVGKTLDWRPDPVLVLKTVPDHGYASLTVVDLALCDLFGLGSPVHSLLQSPYVPFDGMNQRGLVVSMLSVEGSAQYPDDPGAVVVGDFNLIRIVLDTCADADEAVAAMGRFCIVQNGPQPVHYLVADPRKACVVELAGGRVAVREAAGPLAVTNLPVTGPGAGPEACTRYRTLVQDLDRREPVTIRRARSLLDRVSVFPEDGRLPSTLWSLVYSPGRRGLEIRTGRERIWYRLSLGDGHG